MYLLPRLVKETQCFISAQVIHMYKKINQSSVRPRYQHTALTVKSRDLTFSTEVSYTIKAPNIITYEFNTILGIPYKCNII